MVARWLLFHVASGQAFLTGAACLVVASGLSGLARRRWLVVGRNILVGLGGVLVASSATPLAWGVYLALVVVSVAWLGSEARSEKFPGRWLIRLRGLVAVAWLGAGGFEATYQVVPGLPRLDHPTLGIVGDSLTAGMGDSDLTTWPQRLSARHGVIVRDHSVAGATVKSAARQAEMVAPDDRLVLLEIGGNDLLGGTTPEAFEAGLARLLAIIGRPGRLVVMLELPLLPGYNRFGQIQRRLAAKHRVILVPKRILLGVLLTDGATLDSIHLSALGHDRMAAAIWDVVHPADPD